MPITDSPHFVLVRRWLKRFARYLFVLVFLIYYPIGMVWVHKVDDSADFTAGKYEVAGGSHAVAITAALMNREISRHWAPNDPFFYPGAALVRMPAFQRGVVSATARFTLTLSDHLSRMRGSSTADADIQRAVGMLNYPPTVWLYDSSISWLPIASSEAQYRSGVEALRKYNERVAAGQAVYEKRADNLQEALYRIVADIGGGSGSIDDFVTGRSAFAFMGSAELYYENKGKMYAYYLILRELGKDFDGVLQEKKMKPGWDVMLESFREGMELNNMLVLNAAPDNQIMPSHLAAQGFYLLRARTQLYEAINILLK